MFEAADGASDQSTCRPDSRRTHVVRLALNVKLKASLLEPRIRRPAPPLRRTGSLSPRRGCPAAGPERVVVTIARPSRIDRDQPVVISPCRPSALSGARSQTRRRCPPRR